MKTYLVTGCAGFVGWKTTELLLTDGHAVVGLDNLNDYYSPRLKKWRLDQLQTTGPARFDFIEGELSDRQLLDKIAATSNIEAVINLAARAGVRASIEQPGIYLDTNLVAFLELLEMMKRHGIGKLVQASSSSVYAGQQSPFREDQVVDCPLSPYAATKKAAESLAYPYHHLHGMDVSIVRYFTVYGPAGRPDMSPLKFTHCIASDIPIPLFGDGEQKRDFTYIDDIARGTIAALQPLGYEILNIGGGNTPVSIREMIEILEELIGKKARIEYYPANPADMQDTSANVSKAGQMLDWHPRTRPEEGLKALVDWYLQESDWLAKEL